MKKRKARIAELERALGWKTVDNEILTYAVELAVETGFPKHRLITPAFGQASRWSMTQVARALGVSRPHLSESLRRSPCVRGTYTKADDEALLVRIRAIIDERTTYGYRRTHARLNWDGEHPPVNHKRVYRVMKQAGLLLTSGRRRPERPHEVEVATLKSNLRWCTDMFEVRCWSGERVHVAFAMDCCDREVLAWVAKPHSVEWLSDNGPPYTAHATRRFGKDSGLLMRTTPSYSPESNGITEAFVKAFKRDYVYVNGVTDAASIIAQLEAYFADYNEFAPDKGLKMLSPRMFKSANLH